MEVSKMRKSLKLQNQPLSFLKSMALGLSVTISFKLMILGWLSCLRILISRTAVMGNPSFSLSVLTFFKPTSSPTKCRFNHYIFKPMTPKPAKTGQYQICCFSWTGQNKPVPNLLFFLNWPKQAKLPLVNQVDQINIYDSTTISCVSLGNKDLLLSTGHLQLNL